MLSTEQIDRYHRDGYLIPDYRVPEAVLEDMDARITHLLDAHPEFRDNCSAVLRWDMDFARYCQVPGILDMAEQLIGPDIALWNMSLFAKPAHDGKATPWHQDGEYWPIRPLATCTVWIAVDTSTRANGCLRVIRGSHRARQLAPHHRNPSEAVTLHQELDADALDLDEAVDLELERGQVSLHDVYLMHGSEPNRSAQRRRGLTLRLMPTTAHYDLEVAEAMYSERGGNNLALNPLLLVRGVDRCARNRFVETLSAAQ